MTQQQNRIKKEGCFKVYKCVFLSALLRACSSVKWCSWDLATVHGAICAKLQQEKKEGKTVNLAIFSWRVFL